MKISTASPKNPVTKARSRIRVLVADDHPAVCDGLCRLLDDEDEFEVVGRSGNGRETVALVRELRPDVAIIDVSMPGLTGIEAATQIKETCPETAVLMVSAYNYESFVLASLRAGAMGYLLKNAPFSELTGAIRMVHAGKLVLDIKVAGDALQRLTKGTGELDADFKELHDREMEILKLVARGISNKEIADKLFISQRTVDTHLINIFRKLGVESRTRAVLRALKKGWLTLDDVP
jgi:two-component system, NarL family, response regulator LiaR